MAGQTARYFGCADIPGDMAHPILGLETERSKASRNISAGMVAG